MRNGWSIGRIENTNFAIYALIFIHPVSATKCDSTHPYHRFSIFN